MGAIQQCRCLPETVEGVSGPREPEDCEVVRLPRWVKYIDNKSMCAYWHNVTTGETVWEQPEEYANHSSVLEFNDEDDARPPPPRKSRSHWMPSGASPTKGDAERTPFKLLSDAVTVGQCERSQEDDEDENKENRGCPSNARRSNNHTRCTTARRKGKSEAVNDVLKSISETTLALEKAIVEIRKRQQMNSRNSGPHKQADNRSYASSNSY
uniref:WW domain-containing protein n=1 Tax=Lotharella oceanica TaxID=641309 RepID=A0A7S2TLA3_9EUKA